MSSGDHDNVASDQQSAASPTCRDTHPGWPRAGLLILGGVFAAIGGLGVYGTIRFTQIAAWELPAHGLLGLSVTVGLLGVVLEVLGATARTRPQATRRLFKTLLLLGSLGIGAYFGNVMLGLLEPDRTFDLKSAYPNYDAKPFLTTVPLFETHRPGTTPPEARYPPSLTLRHCAQDFDVTVHTTALGLRSIDRKPTAPATLAIGDSFCFGWGVEDDQTYAAILGWQNAGLWGRPPCTHIKALQWWAPRLRPKRVVWGIYLPHLITELPDHWLSPYQYPNLDGPLSRTILDWYHETGVGRFLYQRFGLAINRGNYFTKELMLYRDPTPELMDVYVSTGSNFLVAKQLADEFGFETWFVLLPSKRMLEMHSMGSSAAQLPIDRLKEQIVGAGFSPEHIIDLLPAFAESKKPDMFFPHDAHWTADGHRFVADHLRDLIVSKPSMP